MKIILAPNALKGSLSAPNAARAMELGIKRIVPDADTIHLPVSDGGDGLLQIFETMLPCKRITQTVRGPLAQQIKADFLFCEADNTAVIEMAQASGMALLETNQLDPMSASSYGVGELILHALELGATSIVLGIGGSASCDGGSGLLSALGARFLDKNNRPLEGNGKSLRNLASIDLDSLDRRLASIKLQVLCDVENPLLGNSGAARVFAPQKGATGAQVEQLEKGLTRLADVIESELNLDVRNISGAGAAGGAGAGLAGILRAELEPGAEYLLQLCEFDRALAGTSLVLTAEGRIDDQSSYGKATSVVAQHASAKGIPCYTIAGSIGPGVGKLHTCGFNSVFSLCNENMTKDECMQNAYALLADATEQAIAYFLTSSSGFRL